MTVSSTEVADKEANGKHGIARRCTKIFQERLTPYRDRGRVNSVGNENGIAEHGKERMYGYCGEQQSFAVTLPAGLPLRIPNR